MKLSAQGQLDVQSQAKTLVTIAVVANLLLALVLSLLLLFSPGHPEAAGDAAQQSSLDQTESPRTADLRGMQMLPDPSDW